MRKFKKDRRFKKDIGQCRCKRGPSQYRCIPQDEGFAWECVYCGERKDTTVDIGFIEVPLPGDLEKIEVDFPDCSMEIFLIEEPCKKVEEIIFPDIQVKN